MKKTAYKTLRISFSAGETLAEKDITLDKGERIVAAIATSVEPNQLVNLGLYENGNTEVSAPMDLSFWRKSNAGHYLDGFKPLDYRGGSTISARLSTSAVLAADLDVEIVFGIIKEDPTC